MKISYLILKILNFFQNLLKKIYNANNCLRNFFILNLRFQFNFSFK